MHYMIDLSAPRFFVSQINNFKDKCPLKYNCLFKQLPLRLERLLGKVCKNAFNSHLSIFLHTFLHIICADIKQLSFQISPLWTLGTAFSSVHVLD